MTGFLLAAAGMSMDYENTMIYWGMACLIEKTD